MSPQAKRKRTAAYERRRGRAGETRGKSRRSR